MCAQLANSAFVNGTCLGCATMLALKFGVLHPGRHFGGQCYKALEDLRYTKKGKRKKETEIGSKDIIKAVEKALEDLRYTNKKGKNRGQ